MSEQFSVYLRLLVVLGGAATMACTGANSPAAPTAATPLSPAVVIDSAVAQAPLEAGPPWGPETPGFNLQVILRGDGGGFGHVKFRQPNDDQLIIHLDTWVRGLQPLTSYVLQRAVDPTLDRVCTGTGWLTLGKGAVPQAITTDARGSGVEELFRDISAFPVGTRFDIHFRVLHQATSAVVLTSECYQFVISR